MGADSATGATPPTGSPSSPGPAAGGVPAWRRHSPPRGWVPASAPVADRPHPFAAVPSPRDRRDRFRPGGGVLVNVSSGAATKPYEGWAAYRASKTAAELVTEVVALEGRRSVRAFALSPGLVDTDMTRARTAAR